MNWHFLDFFFIAFPTIITIVDPPGALAPFAAMTANDSPQKRLKTAKTACLMAAIILLTCATTGSLLFRVFGFTIPALKIAGGFLLFKVAVDMLHAKMPASKTTEAEEAEGTVKDDVAIFPLAIPLLSGPGSIASVLILSDQAEGIFQHVYLYLSIIITLVIAFFMFKNATYLTKLMGQIGLNVFERLMGLVLAAISVQFILDGIAVALPGLIK